jgi:hypothetical protein
LCEAGNYLLCQSFLEKVSLASHDIISPSLRDPKDEEWEERLRVLEDSRKLRLVAEFFMHPEAKVQSAHSVTRCFFDRPSAPERVALEDMEEQAQVMEDLKLLKQHAIFFYHPEQNIAVTDATAFGRNYFDRASGPEQISEDELDQMDEIFKDIRALQIAASDYLHPERPLLVDAYVCARNYFSRPSEPEYETFGAAEERARIVAEARALKHQAEIFAHPEKPIETTDATMFGRNYFARSSASEQENVDECEERARILAECAGLKQSAQHFMHPEIGVKPSSGAVSRNYFDRPSAPVHGKMIHTFPAHEDELDHDEGHDHLDHFGMDEELEHMFNNIRQDLSIPEPVNRKGKAYSDDGDEGNLSRSPSSVMLFAGESVYD